MFLGKKKLEVVLSPSLLNLRPLADSVVVVIDILRATSTIVTMIQHGVTYIVPVDDVQECASLAKKLGGESVGERNGVIAEGLELPNSPLAFKTTQIQNKIFVLTTTNGTKVLYQAKKLGASEIIIGAFLNLNAIVNYLAKQNKNVVLICAGWKNMVNVEDTLFAGAVASTLHHIFETNVCDSAVIAQHLYKNVKTDLKKFATNISHYQRLLSMGNQEDVKFCFEQSIYNVVPIFDQDKIINLKFCC